MSLHRDDGPDGSPPPSGLAVALALAGIGSLAVAGLLFLAVRFSW